MCLGEPVTATIHSYALTLVVSIMKNLTVSSLEDGPQVPIKQLQLESPKGPQGQVLS